MKKFILKIIIFSIPLFFIFMEIFLPLNVFTFRPWETLLFKNSDEQPWAFYPNRTIQMLSKGDLCFNTQYAVTKYENWTTDHLGFRNNTFIKKANILLIGDSFIAGSSLPQDSTITNLLSLKSGAKVYNLAPAYFRDFIYLLNNRIIEKPNLIIFSKVERCAPESMTIPQNEYKALGELDVFSDRVSRLYLFKYLYSKLTGSHGSGIPGVINKNQHFLNGKSQVYLDDQINTIVDMISQYKAYCDSLGIGFIFLPMPNKETVYYRNVPFEHQPAFLYKLYDNLRNKNIKFINILDRFNEITTLEPEKQLYHLDDTHWNGNGVEVTAEEIMRFIKANNISYR